MASSAQRRSRSGWRSTASCRRLMTVAWRCRASSRSAASSSTSRCRSFQLATGMIAQGSEASRPKGSPRQRARAASKCATAVGLGGGQAAGVGDEQPEALDVDLLVRHREPVAAGFRADRVGTPASTSRRRNRLTAMRRGATLELGTSVGQTASAGSSIEYLARPPPARAPSSRSAFRPPTLVAPCGPWRRTPPRRTRTATSAIRIRVRGRRPPDQATWWRAAAGRRRRRRLQGVTRHEHEPGDDGHRCGDLRVERSAGRRGEGRPRARRGLRARTRPRSR